MAQPDWNNGKAWVRGRPMTLLESFGFSKFKLTYPELKPKLPDVSAGAQRPIPISGTVSPGGGPSGSKPGGGPPPKGPVQQYARKLLAQHHWPNQFHFIRLIIGAEDSSWNPHAKNPTSGAYGIAQALGHGGPADQGTESDNYGGFGLTHKQAKEANSGNPYWQLAWMMNYIKATYGTPENAWAFHQAHNSY